MSRARLLPVALLGMGIFAVAAVSSPVVSSDLEANRRLLQEIHNSDPEHYARLRDGYERFRAWKPERQEQLRQLDRQLHEQDTQKQAHLTHVLGDYAAWLTRLPAAQQQRVQQAASTTERLQVIRDIRNQQWLAGLPRVQQEEYRAAPDKRKAELLAKWHKEEQKRDQEWASARRQWQEVGERPQAIVAQEEFRYFVQNKLRPMLSPEENARLTEVWAKSNHAQYVRAVVELADKHPVLMLDKSPKYPNFESLPPEYKEAIRKLPGEVAQQVRRNPATGRSPAYALEVTETLRRYERAPKKQLGPATAADFSADIERFVQNLPPADRQQLKAVEGRWPEYPKMLHELAHQHKVALPELSLPGDPRHWEQVRKARGIWALP